VTKHRESRVAHPGAVKDSVGGEGDLILPLSGWVVGLRIEPEFSARNRTEGWMSLLTIAYSLQ